MLFVPRTVGDSRDAVDVLSGLRFNLYMPSSVSLFLEFMRVLYSYRDAGFRSVRGMHVGKLMRSEKHNCG